ncbi:MAG: peptide-methionine (S)-S-oxide reductase MsrA, partial [Nitrospirales bacterium]
MTRTRFLNLLVIALIGLSVVGAAHATEAPVSRTPSHDAELGKATFAGGCFWCMEEVFEQVDGVVSVVSGYTGGQKKNPTYQEVSHGGTGHAEAVEVLYDPKQVTYRQLLDTFWRNIDPTTADRQFCDSGDQYRPAIFYHDETQKRLAEASRQQVETTKPFNGPILTEISAATTFYTAEDYHQDF